MQLGTLARARDIAKTLARGSLEIRSLMPAIADFNNPPDCYNRKARSWLGCAPSVRPAGR
jgi:hypothetical protein